MKIPRKFPQFEGYPVLFVSSGEYEAKFYLAQNGEISLEDEIKMPPREEAKEKQGFVGKKAGMQSFSAVSHKGNYIEDLKKKFQKKVHQIIRDFLAKYRSEEIYLFAPTYAARRIMDGLKKDEQRKVRMEFHSEFTKLNPLVMLEVFWDEAQRIIAERVPIGEEEQKILSRPKMK